MIIPLSLIYSSALILCSVHAAPISFSPLLGFGWLKGGSNAKSGVMVGAVVDLSKSNTQSTSASQSAVAATQLNLDAQGRPIPVPAGTIMKPSGSIQQIPVQMPGTNSQVTFASLVLPPEAMAKVAATPPHSKRDELDNTPEMTEEDFKKILAYTSLSAVASSAVGSRTDTNNSP